MKPRARFVIVALITLGCATEANTPQGAFAELGDAGGAAGGGSGGVANSSGSSSGGNGIAGTSAQTAGTFSTAGTVGTAGGGGTSGGSGPASSGGASGSGGSGGATGGGGASGGSGGKSTGGSAGSTTGGSAGSSAGTSGTGGTGGTGTVMPYCDTHPKSPLPYTVNDGFQPSGWQGDISAISVPTVAPDPCDARAPGSVGFCSKWRFTPNAVTPAWAGVSWSKVWDPQTTHPPVCIAAGATKVTFQARGAAGGEHVTFSAAGAAELPFTLTNAWKEYSISLVGVQYNTDADGVDAGFFWKVTPPTPGAQPVTFFVDDIQFNK